MSKQGTDEHIAIGGNGSCLVDNDRYCTLAEKIDDVHEMLVNLCGVVKSIDERTRRLEAAVLPRTEG